MNREQRISLGTALHNHEFCMKVLQRALMLDEHPERLAGYLSFVRGIMKGQRDMLESEYEYLLPVLLEAGDA